MRKCMVCRRRIWPWQVATQSGFFHYGCYVRRYRIAPDSSERVILYPGEEQSVTVTAEEIRQMQLRAQQEDDL